MTSRMDLSLKDRDIELATKCLFPFFSLYRVLFHLPPHPIKSQALYQTHPQMLFKYKKKTKVIKANLLEFDCYLDFDFEDTIRFCNIPVWVTFKF